MKPIRIGLVEDQYLFRKGIIQILEQWPELEVMFESANGYSVMEALNALPELPDVLLADVSLPPNGLQEYSGLDLVTDLRANNLPVKVVMLSVHTDPFLIAKVIECGANGYLVKNSDPLEVRQAIVAVHQSGSYFNSLTLEAVQQRLQGKSKPMVAGQSLSKREVEVLKLVCQQLTAEEIGEKLFISTATVNGHRNKLLQKTGSKNATGLVMYAIKHQIVEVL